MKSQGAVKWKNLTFIPLTPGLILHHGHEGGHVFVFHKTPIAFIDENTVQGAVKWKNWIFIPLTPDLDVYHSYEGGYVYIFHWTLIAFLDEKQLKEPSNEIT